MNGGGKEVSQNGGRISWSPESMEVLSRAQSQPDASRNSSALLKLMDRIEYFRSSSICVKNPFCDGMGLYSSRRNNIEE